MAEPTMEKNSAACAMEWSIELDKALRSRNTGRAVQAILQLGPRLERWSREPEPKMAVFSMFGLVPGEDRLFANTILLRLADAFRLGDKSLRLAVVNVFRCELRNRNGKKRKGNGGILSKTRVHNQSELLRRVKVVFDSGDAESRALALILFGCWADFAKDSAQIRYLILSGLVSSHVLEVKASLYAAGCFCELSDDFAPVVLEMLINLVTSSEISLTVRLAGVRIFAKMRSSFSVASRAYKTGLKLVLDSSEEDLLVVLLVSLTKLASKLTVLMSEQVELLLSFLSRERNVRMRETALRCMHFLLVKGVVYIPTNANIIRPLISIFDETEVSSALQCQALQILHKILLYDLPNLPCMEMLEFAKLLTVIRNASQSPVLSNSLLATSVLADISSKLMGRPETGSDGICCSFHPREIILLIIEHMTLLVKPFFYLDHTESQVSQDIKSLFGLLLFLVGEHPDLGSLVLDNVNIFVEYILNMQGSVIRPEDLPATDIESFKGERSIVIRSKLVFYVFKFMVDCLESLSEAGGITTQVLDKAKALDGSVHGCVSFDGYMHTEFSILLHSRIIWGCMVNENKANCNLDRDLGVSLQDSLVDCEVFSLRCAKMLTKRDNWSSYRAGIYAACQAAWFTATFIFGQLLTRVQSDYCCGWLKSLIQLAHAESKIQLFVLPKERSNIIDWLEINKTSILLLGDDFDEVGLDASGNMNAPVLTKILLGASYGIFSSGESLDAAAVSSGQAFSFQRWFLALRAKVLGTVTEILKVGVVPDQNVISNVGLVHNCNMLETLKSLQQLSFRLKRLAREYDLIATSFIDMDNKSSKIISALALSCSLLAFTTGFSTFIPNLRAHESTETFDPENKAACLQAVLLQNLVGRLKNIDCDTRRNISSLLEVSGHPKNCFHLQSRNQILNIGCEARHLHTVCNYAVSRVVCLQNEASVMRSEEIVSKITKDGLQLLVDVIMKWMNVPFRIPKYFFKVRPCMGSELFASGADARNSDRILVTPGSHLSLNLCLQLKNLPSNLPVRLTKLYCILSSGPSFLATRPTGGSKEQEQQAYYKPWETDDMLEMNEKLLHYVTERTKKTNGKRRRDTDKDQRVVDAFSRFEVNEKGQGFSNCILDVSNIPVGRYRIRWHSCCIDNQGRYWSLLPLNAGPVFTVQESPEFL